MALSPITTDSGNTTNSSGLSAERFTEESTRVKEKQKAEEKNTERAQAEKKELKVAGDEKKIKNEVRAAEDIEKEEKNRRINDWQRHRDEEAKEAENKEQAGAMQLERTPSKSYSETANSNKENSAIGIKKNDSITLSKTAARLNDLATRFENTNNKTSLQNNDWATDEDAVYRELQITKNTIQQQSSAAIFSQANVSPAKVLSFFR